MPKKSINKKKPIETNNNINININNNNNVF